MSRDQFSFAEQYFAARAVRTHGGCLLWVRRLCPAGYGRATFRGHSVTAHKLAWELERGPVPDGMTIDHICFQPACVEITHLRLLTRSANASNQRAAYATHCLRGHEYTPENTRVRTQGNGVRNCKTCHRERELARYHRTRGLPA